MTFPIRTLLFLAIVIYGVPSAKAVDKDDDTRTKLQVTMTGIGARTCEYWLSNSTHRAEGTVWIYGFWTGLNYVAAASNQAQSQADERAMIDQVTSLCRRNPKEALAIASWDAYIVIHQKNPPS